MKASYIGNQLLIAHAFEYMGYGYLRRGDYQNAYGAYAVAAERYVGTVQAHVAGTCKDNMARIKVKEENTGMIIGFYRPAADVDSEILFYPFLQVCE